MKTTFKVKSLEELLAGGYQLNKRSKWSRLAKTCLIDKKPLKSYDGSHSIGFLSKNQVDNLLGKKVKIFKYHLKGDGKTLNGVRVRTTCKAGCEMIAWLAGDALVGFDEKVFLKSVQGLQVADLKIGYSNRGYLKERSQMTKGRFSDGKIVAFEGLISVGDDFYDADQLLQAVKTAHRIATKK